MGLRIAPLEKKCLPKWRGRNFEIERWRIDSGSRTATKLSVTYPVFPCRQSILMKVGNCFGQVSGLTMRNVENETAISFNDIL